MKTAVILVAFIGLASAGAINPNPKISNLNHPQIECTLCEEAVLKVEQLMEDGEPEIQKAMTAWCKDLGPAAKSCTLMIDQYIDNIIDGITAKQGPGVICIEIHMCDKW